MDRLIRWSDAWVSSLAHPEEGEVERVYYDPQVARHRLVITRTLKKFEVQMQRPAQHGPKKTYVVQTGIFPDVSVEQSREKANVIIGRIRRGEEPRGRPAEKETKLGSAWEKYKKRKFKPRTIKMYEGHYRRNLEKWKDVTLRALVMDNTSMVPDEHDAITERAGPSEADHAMRLLRSIYKHEAMLDTSLPADRNPCTVLKHKWHGDRKRTGAAIPRAEMPTWKKQLETLRKKSPIRAAYTPQG